eukprot:TRINITY_DN2426_c2_g1_i1.p3 TRINITY_DN2426_c2_g1~~TRINITY_DN2426_c2_g1_i1.p3  ORF type:complete len:108 (-),score=2.33 TRINITY_DN2426_c2_g1_i1:228-551(-)
MFSIYFFYKFKCFKMLIIKEFSKVSLKSLFGLLIFFEEFQSIFCKFPLCTHDRKVGFQERQFFEKQVKSLFYESIFGWQVFPLNEESLLTRFTNFPLKSVVYRKNSF